MKRILIIVMLFWCEWEIYAQGIQFESLNYEQALIKAKQEGKYVMLNFSGSWCVPCAKMEKNVLPQQEVGDFFNAHFINIQFITDKSKEGKALSKKFNNKFVPTYLILTPDGTLIHKLSGYGDAEQFIQWAERGLDKKKNFHYLMHKAAKNKKMNKEEMMYYYLNLRDAHEDDKANQVREELWRILKEEDLLQPLYWDLFENTNWKDSQFKFVEQHVRELMNTSKAERVNAYLLKNYKDIISEIVWKQKNHQVDSLTKLCKQIAAVNFPGRDYILPRTALLKASYAKDDEGIINNLYTIIHANELPGSHVDDCFYWAKFENISSDDTFQAVLKEFDVLIDRYYKNNKNITAIWLKGWVQDNLLGRPRGIFFRYNYTLADALYKGKSLTKNILVEIAEYNDHRGMESVYVNDSVGEIVNRNYITILLSPNDQNLKNWLKKENCTPSQYPYFVIISSQDTSEIHEFGVFKSKEDFLKNIERASDRDAAFGNLKKLVQNNSLTTKQRINYIQDLRLMGNNNRFREEMDKLFEELNDKERMSLQYWTIFCESEFGTKTADWLLAHPKELMKIVGKEEFKKYIVRLNNSFNANLYNFLINEDVSQMVYKTGTIVEDAIKDFRKKINTDIFHENKEEVAMLDMFEAIWKNDVDKYVKALDAISVQYNPDVHHWLFPVFILWGERECVKDERYIKAIRKMYPKFKNSMANLKQEDRSILMVMEIFLNNTQKVSMN